MLTVYGVRFRDSGVLELWQRRHPVVKQNRAPPARRPDGARGQAASMLDLRFRTASQTKNIASGAIRTRFHSGMNMKPSGWKPHLRPDQ